MKKTLVRIALILEVVLILAMIWYFSSQNRGSSSNLSQSITRWLLEHFRPGFADLAVREQRAMIRKMNSVIRKCAHFGEFALMGQALFCLVKVMKETMETKRIMAIAFTCSALFAAGDELHQHFVAGRGPQVRDVLIDVLGALTGILISVWILSRWRAGKTAVNATVPDRHNV